MKISEMNCDQATEAMIRISGPISNIVDDDDALALIDEIQKLAKDDPNMHPVRQIAKFLPKIVTFGLKKHKTDLYEIVGALTDTPVGKVGAMNFGQIYQEVKESYDDVLAGFFTRSGKSTSSNGNESA